MSIHAGSCLNYLGRYRVLNGRLDLRTNLSFHGCFDLRANLSFHGFRYLCANLCTNGFGHANFHLRVHGCGYLFRDQVALRVHGVRYGLQGLRVNCISIQGSDNAV